MNDNHSMPISAAPEALWILLSHEARAPDSYTDDATLFAFKEISPTCFERSVSRNGTRYEEMIEVNQDALMVEQTWNARGRHPLKLILQLLPMEGATLLNLAANVVDEGDENLTAPDLPDLMALALSFRKMAEAL